MSERLDDDVLVCRCEEVTAGDIRRAIRAGATDVTQVKLRTSAGIKGTFRGAGRPEQRGPGHLQPLRRGGADRG